MYKKEITTNITFCSIDELDEREKELIEAAKKSSLDAYAPYSNFKVGAALLLDNGEILSANNQENLASPSGLCAERIVLLYANASHPHTKPLAMAIAAHTKAEFCEEPVSPCGACRQVLVEVEQRYQTKIRLLLYGQKEIALLESAGSLLPLSFNM